MYESSSAKLGLILGDEEYSEPRTTEIIRCARNSDRLGTNIEETSLTKRKQTIAMPQKKNCRPFSAGAEKSVRLSSKCIVEGILVEMITSILKTKCRKHTGGLTQYKFDYAMSALSLFPTVYFIIHCL